MTDVARNAREIREGLTNVTHGPWTVYDGCSWRRIGTVSTPEHPNYHDCAVLAPTKASDGHPDLTCASGFDLEANLEHIARCSPDIIGPICTAAEEAEALREEIARLRKALTTLVEAKALSEVRALVAGWNGEGKPDGPYERHRNGLGATLPKTNCGRVYELDDAMQAARSLLAARAS